MERINLDQVLRYAFAGGVALITLRLVNPPQFLRWWNIEKPSDAIVILAVLVTGALIYVLHRAVAHPFLLRATIVACLRCGCWSADKVTWNPLSVPAWEADLTRWLWSDTRDGKPLRKALAEWAAQVHFLYCPAWAILAAVLAGFVLPDTIPARQAIFAIIGFLLLVSAFVHDMRLLMTVHAMRAAKAAAGA